MHLSALHLIGSLQEVCILQAKLTLSAACGCTVYYLPETDASSAVIAVSAASAQHTATTA